MWNSWSDVSFAYPWLLWSLLLLPLLAFWQWKVKNQSMQRIGFYSNAFLSQHKTWKVYFQQAMPWLKYLALALMIIALARPQSASSWQDVRAEGIDIVMSLDISTSMLAEDLKPNRLEASKAVAIDFIDERPNDRIGLVIFSGESFTQCPLTTDHDVLKNLFKDLECGMLSDGTAVGLGLATSINRLKNSTAKSKVIILLTDGANNAGEIDPISAAEIAKTFGIRVYTIGVGTLGMAPYPFKDMFGRTVYQNVEVKIDEKTMRQISEMSGGKYFRASSNQKLQKIYQEIDQMEKTLFEVSEFKNKKEVFFPFALAALALLTIEALLSLTWLKRLV